MYHCVVTLLGIFSHGFDDHASLLLPRQRTLSQTIALGPVIPDLTSETMRVRAHFKSVTCAEHFSDLKTIRTHDQYNFLRFRITSTSWPLVY